MTGTCGPLFVERSVCCASLSGLHRMVYGEWGERSNPKVLVCVHGLSRNGHDFDDLAQALAGDYRVICPDVVGRGRSDWLRDPAGYTIPQYVADMMVLIARLDVETVHWLGTSMGGLIGMVLASLENTPVTRLLLNDVGPEISSASIRRIGEYIGRAPKFDSFDEAEKYIRLVSAPFGALTDAQWRQLTASSLRLSADGRHELCYDPGIGETFRRDAEAFDLWPIYDRVRCPTLLVRGRLADLLSEEGARDFLALVPHARFADVSDAGHMVAGDRNDRFSAAVLEFLDELRAA